MSASICLLPLALSELFAHANDSGSLTLADRYGLMAALLDETLDDEERSAVDRILRAVRQRRLTVIDEISTVMDIDPADCFHLQA